VEVGAPKTAVGSAVAMAAAAGSGPDATPPAAVVRHANRAAVARHASREAAVRRVRRGHKTGPEGTAVDPREPVLAPAQERTR
jgi:hypothetical protein